MQRTELNKNVIWTKLHGKENPNMNRLTDKAHLFYTPEIGLRMHLSGRDGVLDSSGIVTSTVTGIEQFSRGLLVRTLNSVYFVEYDNSN